MLGIVMMAGDPGQTMDDHVYYDYKYKIMQTGANTFKFDDHIVYAYINNERNSLFSLHNTLCFQLLVTF